MGRSAASLAALATWQLVWFLVTIDGQGLRKLNTTVAKEHVGEIAMVCGHVIGYSCTAANGGSMALATNDRRSQFDLRIPYDDRAKFGPNPEEQHLQRLVCATGRIDKSRFGHEIVIGDANALTVLPDRAGLPLFAAGVSRPCDPGVTLPKAKREGKPVYTDRAMREGVEGQVLLQAVVATDGNVREARVIRGLHRDLDAEAVNAMRRWRFEPGTLNGQPAPVLVTIELTFTLRNGR
jgi:TonB family protein